MKKISTIFGAVLVMMAFSLGSVNAQEYQNGIKIEPLSIFKNQYFQIGYERALNENLTVGLNLGPQYAAKEDSSLSTGISGISIDPQFRFYPQEAMGGAFFGVYSSIRLDKSDVSDFYSFYDDNWQSGDTYYKKKQVYIFGLQGGFEKCWDGFLFDFYMGFGYKIKQRDYLNDRTEQIVYALPTRGIATRGNISFGYAF